MRVWRSIQVAGLLFLSTLACSDRLPTEPAPAAAQATVDSQTVPVARLHRPGTRVVPPRVSAISQLQGRWGGEQVGLTIGSSNAAVEFGCAAGSIDGPFVTDSSGRFALVGSWWFTPPVVIEGWQPEKRPALYSGVVDAGTMTLTVTLLDDSQLVGSFSLAYNQIPRILHCLAPS